MDVVVKRTMSFFVSYLFAMVGALAVFNELDLECQTSEERHTGCRRRELFWLGAGFGWLGICIILVHLQSHINRAIIYVERLENADRYLESFFMKILIEFYNIVLGIVFLVISAVVPDKVTVKCGILLCVCLYASIAFIYLPLLESNSSAEDAVGSILVGVVYVATKHNIKLMFEGASVTFLRQFVVFLWTSMKIYWYGNRRVKALRLLERLEERLNTKGHLDEEGTRIITGVKACL